MRTERTSKGTMAEKNSGVAVIIGAGPAGLTAAYELLERTGYTPIVLEGTDQVGGISRTVNYKGNRIDIGGHRFFSKSDRVMDWWMDMLPMQRTDGKQTITYHRRTTEVGGAEQGPDPDSTDEVMLLRGRKSRIYFSRRFFDYPISLSPDTLKKLGILRSMKIGFSYIRSALFPIRNEKNLEEFFINRFGRELYGTFFKSYTEKVWGVPCNEISAEWGAQRVKGLSISKAILHFARKLFSPATDVSQKNVETSLIEQFLYPKFGPGQMWETVTRKVQERGGQILMQHKVTRIVADASGKIVAVRAVDADGNEIEIKGDLFFSTMPVRSLVRALGDDVPKPIIEIAEGLQYRNFVTVGLLYDHLKVRESDGSPIKDNWIYIQEPDVLVGRLQIFNNWSPYLVADQTKTWVGLEYFCSDKETLWTASDTEMIELAKTEMERIGIAAASDCRDGVVIHVPKTYPAYFGSYDRFDEIRNYVDTFPNLYLLGRNGMHRYNNQDHSMLTAMVAVDNIVEGRTDKANIWEINTEEEYHEEKK